MIVFVFHGKVEEPVEAGAVPDSLVGGPRVVAGGGDDDAAREEREHGGQDRHDDPAGALGGAELDDEVGRRLLVGRDVRGRTSLRSRRRLLPAAEHLEADLLLARARRVLADDPSLVHDEDAVGQREHLVELERDEQDRVTRVALGDQPPMDVLDRADVEPARRLRRDQDDRVARDLARDDDLLLVAAGERPREGERAAAADVELLDQAHRPLHEPRGVEPAVLRVRRPVVVVQREVLGEVELEHEPAALPVLRDVPDPRVDHHARREVALELAAADRDASRSRSAAGR